jgi:hypothetical protein
MTDLLERARRRSLYLHNSSAERLIDDLAAEVERLRAALQEIASQCHNIPRGITADRIDQIARRALEPKL